MQKKFLILILTIFSFFLDASSKRGEALIINPLWPKAGMFATFDIVLGHLHLYETGYYPDVTGFKVDFGRQGAYYDPRRGKNWWSYYFEIVPLANSKNIRIATNKEHEKAWLTRMKLTRKEAKALLDKYIRINERILKKADQFAKKKFENDFIVGVHYRGTDKERAPRVPYEEAIAVISSEIEKLNLSSYKIFVASDEEPFVKKMQASFPGKVVAIEAFRSQVEANEKGVHQVNNPPYELGEQALLDALLLAKSHLLIRTSSNLSLWSTYYNPEVPVIMLNHQYNNRPE